MAKTQTDKELEQAMANARRMLDEDVMAHNPDAWEVDSFQEQDEQETEIGRLEALDSVLEWKNYFDDAAEWKNSSGKRKPRKTDAEKLEEIKEKKEQLKEKKEQLEKREARIKSRMNKAESDARDKRLKQIGAEVERYFGQITDIEKFSAALAVYVDAIKREM